MIEMAVIKKDRIEDGVQIWTLVVRMDDGRVYSSSVEDLETQISAHLVPGGAEVTLSFLTTTLVESFDTDHVPDPRPEPLPADDDWKSS
jgi:hypothetical protein